MGDEKIKCLLLLGKTNSIFKTLVAAEIFDILYKCI